MRSLVFKYCPRMLILVLCHDLVDGGEDAGLVSVNVDEAMSTP